MKRILIFSHALELGGAERSLLGLLDSIEYPQYAVDLFLMRHAGELLPYINPQVHLLPEMPQYASLAVPMKEVLRKGQVGVAFGRLRGKYCAKQKLNMLGISGEQGISLEYSHKYTVPFMPEIQPHITYDLAVSFLTPHYFAAQKVRAKQYLAWIHTDYLAVQTDQKSEAAMWGRYDTIASISGSVSRSFIAVFPSLAPKIISIENILPEKLIRMQATGREVSEEMPQNGAIRLLSVGRYCTAKNFDNVPDICRRIREQGVNIQWYIIGFGGDETLIRRKIAEAGMEKHVILLGKKENPYPYINACDVYVQPSRYEGKCISVREAQMLGKPVVITRYATSSSQLQDGVDGVIVPMENKGCANALVELLNEKETLRRVAENTKNYDYSNRDEVQKLYRLME